MSDPVTITAIAGNLRTALDLAKIVRTGLNSLERAEVQLKLAELISALADAKVEVADIQEQLTSKDERIAELEEALENKDSLVRAGDAMYRKGEAGRPFGVAFCLRCWDVDQQLRQLKAGFGGGISAPTNICPACKTVYHQALTRKIAPVHESPSIELS